MEPRKENRGMGRIQSVLKLAWEGGILGELALFPILGAVAYVLFLRAAALGPVEGALLIVMTAGLLRLGLQWWGWHRRLTRDGSLLDWVHRTLQGEREPQQVPEGLSEQGRLLARALNDVIEDLREQRAGLAGLQLAMTREWRDLDALLGTVQGQHEIEAEARLRGHARLDSLGRDLKVAFEDTLRLDQVELNYRLRADQSRLQGQAFRGALEQVLAGLEQFENHLEELQDTFPRLRREEDALRRLADAGLRQGARLNLSTKGLVAHTSRLVEDAQGRSEWLRKMRQSADRVRDQTEALARRMGGFREEAQTRIRAFGGAQGTLKELDQVAQQTGLLAVNAAILAQQESGSAGLAEIGGRLRHLADQTAEGAADLGRMLGDHQQGLEHETIGLWDLQEVTQKLLAEVHELLRMSGHLDQQGQDLERALEAHLGLVDQMRQSSERTELSLHEVNARALALEAAHGRQWSVEAKLAPEQERLARMGRRLAEVGDGLILGSQQSIDEIWTILARHQEVRRTGAYRQVTSEGLAQLVEAPEGAHGVWNTVAWARAQRRSRLEQANGGAIPMGRLDPNGGLQLLLLGQDALHNPEGSALESWACDPTGQIWDLCLLTALRTEGYRLALLALLKASPVATCFPTLDMRITPEGVRVRLPHPYPGLPGFLAGLRLELQVEPGLLDHSFRESAPGPLAVQRLIWLGPNQGGGLCHPWIRLAHAWVQEEPHHERLLSWLPYRKQRPPCPWSGDDDVPVSSLDPVTVRALGLGADPASLEPFLERLLQAGATPGPGGLALCAVGIGHPHPEALLLRLFQPDAELAGAFHPDLVPYQIRVREEVLGGTAVDPYRAAWSILEDLQREGWMMPLPPE
jgi:hypothetical protein